MQYIITYLISLITLTLLDILRLGFVMKKTISGRMGGLMRDQILLLPAVLFYIFYAGAIVVFAILPAVRMGNIRIATGYGALLGFTAYMTYDLTNLATLKGWPLAMVIPDILRGTFVTAIVAMIGYAIRVRLFA